jgi:hypothetical protein
VPGSLHNPVHAVQRAVEVGLGGRGRRGGIEGGGRPMGGSHVDVHTAAGPGQAELSYSYII